MDFRSGVARLLGGDFLPATQSSTEDNLIDEQGAYGDVTLLPGADLALLRADQDRKAREAEAAQGIRPRR